MNNDSVSSDTAGMISRIERSVGETVGPGEVVMILESMKMEIPVEAPTAGRIAELHVAAGAVVEEGTPLFVIES